MILLSVALALNGCDSKSSSKNLTPAQAQMVMAAHQATIASSERLLMRPLTDSEKECIHIEFKDGGVVGGVTAPLSDTLSKRRAEILGSQPLSPSVESNTTNMSKFQYLISDGGPHILLPTAAVGAWNGASSMTAVIDPNSDYGRACSATANAQMATIKVGSSSALVFADPPMTAWGKSSDGLVELYYLKSWNSSNLDALISKATTALLTTSLTDSGDVLQMSRPDAFLLFAGDTPDKTAYGIYRIPIPAGKYRVLDGTYSSKGESVTIYRLKPF